MENVALILETQLSSDNVLICSGNYTALRYHSWMTQRLSGQHYRQPARRSWTLAWAGKRDPHCKVQNGQGIDKTLVYEYGDLIY